VIVPARPRSWLVVEDPPPATKSPAASSPAGRIPTGGVSDLGAITEPLLERVHEPAALTLSVQFDSAENRWSLWVYPARAR